MILRATRFVLLLCLMACAALPVAHASDEALVLGVFPRRNAAETTRMFTPLADYLRQQLGREVKLATTRDFDSFWKGVADQRYDIVHYNQYHYIRSATHYEVVAHIEEAGRSTISGAIFVRKDSGITSIAQLRGRNVLFGGGEDAMISYIVNRYLMLQAGLNNGDFKSSFAVNPINSVIGLHRKQADAAGAGDGVLDLPVVKTVVNPDELVALAVSPALLHLPVAVKRTMPQKLRASVQASLVGLKSSEAGRAALKAASLTGMGRAEDRDYDPHRKIVRAVLGTLEPR